MQVMQIFEALRHAPLGLALVDSSEVYLFVTNVYAKRFEKCSEQMIGQSVGHFMDTRQYERHIKPKLLKCLAGETVGYQVERRLNGVDRLLTVRYLPCFDEAGKVWGALNIAVDITSDCRSVNLPTSSLRYWDDTVVGTGGSTYIDSDEIQSSVSLHLVVRLPCSTMRCVIHWVRLPPV